MLEFLFAIRANLSARANGTMERFEADLMSFSKALLSINDISGVMTFLNNEDLLFIQVDRVNLLVVTPIDLLMVEFTFYKRSNNLIVHLFAFRKTNGFSY
ncbi:hypothetical protein PDPUS_2_01395 [Photobacterium damselae subsp. piscicida]|uniref:Uncharacterized protein n=3 Tax=Photobacterium damselae TaxID=38293 RepID=A0A7L8A7X7_PHODP|nr:hypothetical protein [Photobacterium damselae]QOD57959.1 hypothetical protein IC627_18965 [Photobacterium damselae subsp. piscicida]BAX55980.1 hypothetical protein PDPUS_2_01395 [Photobacterium damselae subsp. piscicida]